MVMFKVTICDLKNKDRNMADNIEYFYKLYAPLQANCPQLADDFKLLFLIPWDHHRRIIDKCKGNGATDNQRPFDATSMPMWYIRKFTECKPQWFSTLCIRERTCWLL